MKLPDVDFSLSRPRVDELQKQLASGWCVSSHLYAPVVGVALPILDGFIHLGAGIAKLSILAVKLPMRLPTDHSLHEVGLHVYRAVKYFLVAIVGVAGVVSPRLVVWLKETAGLSKRYILVPEKTPVITRTVRNGLLAACAALAAFQAYRTYYKSDSDVTDEEKAYPWLPKKRFGKISKDFFDQVKKTCCAQDCSQSAQQCFTCLQRRYLERLPMPSLMRDLLASNIGTLSTNCIEAYFQSTEQYIACLLPHAIEFYLYWGLAIGVPFNIAVFLLLRPSKASAAKRW